MLSTAIIERDFPVEWNDRGENHGSGWRRGWAWVLLAGPDGTALGGDTRSFVENDKDGSFRMDKIPPGRYRLEINPYGADKDHPYDHFSLPS